MFCTKCGIQISHTAKFCSNCGMSISGKRDTKGKQKIETIQDIPKIKISTIFWWLFWVAIIVYVGLPLLGWGLLELVINWETG